MKKNEECPYCGLEDYEDTHVKGDGSIVYCVDCGIVRKIVGE